MIAAVILLSIIVAAQAWVNLALLNRLLAKHGVEPIGRKAKPPEMEPPVDKRRKIASIEFRN